MFAAMGMLVFGTLLEDFHSIWRAIDSLNLVRVVPRTLVCCAATDRGVSLRMLCQSLIGEFNYADVRDVDPVVGPIFFWSYMITYCNCAAPQPVVHERFCSLPHSSHCFLLPQIILLAAQCVPLHCR